MIALTALLACRPTAVEEGPVSPEPPPDGPASDEPSPKLLVLLVVDQLPTRTIDQVLPLTSGGLRRLSEGYTAVARFPFVPTETCPGHAAISTGTAPARSGIVANAWWDGKQMMYCASPAFDTSLLQAETLSERVRQQQGRAVSFSIKDRSALMMGGPQPTAVAWFDYREAKDVRGSGLEALAPLPDWRCTGTRTWPAPSAELQSKLSGWFPDKQPFEPPERELFPHESECTDARAFIGTPDAGRWLVDMAVRAQEVLGLGEGTAPDLLALSFSQIDVIGHTWTPDSWEMVDGLLQLDQQLARLFEHLDQSVGAGKYSVILTADHGAAPGGAKPLSEQLVIDAMKAAGIDKDQPWALSDPWLWLPDTLAPEARPQVIETLRQQLTGKEGILALVDPSLSAGGNPGDTDPALVKAVQLGWYPDRAGDLAVLRADGWQWVAAGDTKPIVGTTHGSTDDRDSRVPLWVWGAGVKAGRAAQDVDIRQAAPTGAALLGIEPPKDAEVQAITDALAR
jgi:hypothetical protein